MTRDIFAWRDDARELDLRNRAIEADPVARCGSSFPHGYHRLDGSTFCVGNQNVIRAVEAPSNDGLPPGRYTLGEIADYGAQHDAATCATCLSNATRINAMTRSADEPTWWDDWRIGS